MIKAVIFDMDGVIIDSEGVYLKHMLAFVRMINPAVTEEQLRQVVGRSAADCWKRVRELAGVDTPWETLRDQYRSGRWGSPLQVDYRAIFRPEMRLAVAELRRKGYRLAVASSTGLATVRQALDENGIGGEFDAVVSGEIFRESKPNPQIYHHTAGLLGVRVEACLVLEDSTVGIQAALAAGMRVAALTDERFGFEQWRAHYQISRIRDLLDLDVLKEACAL